MKTIKNYKTVLTLLAFNFLLLALSVVVGLSFSSCTKDLYRKVAVNTKEVSAITGSTATVAGRIIDEGEEGATQYGHCWDIAQSPTTDKNKTELGSSAGRKDYTSNLITLVPATKYYVRAYATDKHESNKTVYGAEINFTTATPSLPVLSTASITNITQTSATSGGNISSDGGATVTARGVCWSTSTNPTTTGSHTTDSSGTGSYASSITALTTSTFYYVRAYAINSAGTSYGNQVSFTTTSSGFICGTSTVTDYDGNVYNTVLIGTQCWLKENLKTTHYSNGTAMVNGTGAGDITGNYTTKYYFDYGDNPANTTTYGKLYTWAAVMNGAVSSAANPSGVQGVCPTGWHIPSDAEWTQLTDNLGGESVAGGKMKEAGYAHWASPNTGADNSSGFTALPGGYRDSNGTFDYVGYNGYWWSASELSATEAWGRYLYYSYCGVNRGYNSKSLGFSVRCLRDF